MNPPSQRRFTAKDVIESYVGKRFLEASMVVSFVLYRWPSFYLTAPFLNAGISPNIVTLISLGVGLLGIAAVAVPDPKVQSAGFVLLYISTVLDYIDGNIARCLKRTSHFGKFIDGSTSIILQGLLPMGIGVALALSRDHRWLPLTSSVWIGVAAMKSISFLFSNCLQMRMRAARFELADQINRERATVAAATNPSMVGRLAEQEPNHRDRRMSLHTILARVHAVLCEVEGPLLIAGVWIGLDAYLGFFAAIALLHFLFVLVSTFVSARSVLNYWRPY